MGWIGRLLDVSTAFLTGMALDREVFARAPKEGLPGVNGFPPILPYGLLQILKGAYGLTDAPRLWYLRARDLLTKIGFTELKCCRAVFVLHEIHNQVKRLVGVLTLHVDDGFFFW